MVCRVTTLESLPTETLTSISGLGERFGPISSSPDADSWRLGSCFSCRRTHECNAACLRCFYSSGKAGKYTRVKGEELLSGKPRPPARWGLAPGRCWEFLKQYAVAGGDGDGRAQAGLRLPFRQTSRSCEFVHRGGFHRSRGDLGAGLRLRGGTGMLRCLGPAVRFVPADPGRCQTCERLRISVSSVARLSSPAPSRGARWDFHLRLRCARSPKLGWQKRQQLQTRDE